MQAGHITNLAGNLMWTREGTVYASWRIEALTYNKPIADKRVIRDLHHMLFRSLHGEASIHSALVDHSATTVVTNMIDGVDLDQVPGWVQECEATLDALEDVALGQRHRWLVVPLANVRAERLLTPLRATARNLADRFDLPRRRDLPADYALRVAQAEQVFDLIPAPFNPVPVGVAEQLWVQNHACRRGLIDAPIPEPEALSDVTDVEQTSGAGIIEPLIDEGCRTDPDAPHRLDLLSQRIVKITDHAGHDLHGMPPSYQAVMAVAGVPPHGLVFPGSEIFASLDRCGVDVDWTVHIRVNQREKVLARNRRAVRALNEQFDQREQEAGTGLHDLNLAAKLLTEYDQSFASDKDLVEIEHTILMAVAAAPGPEDTTGEQARQLVDAQAATVTAYMFKDVKIRLERLPGNLTEMWEAMRPGAPRTPIIRAYAQFTSSDKFAMLVPFTQNRLGGDKGPLAALDKSTSRPRPIHLDIAGYPELDLSGSFAVVGELGSGKTVVQKTLMNHVVELGGTFMAIDKSAEGEWARFARTFDTHIVVDPDAPEWSMDPLRMLPIKQGCDVARSVLTNLLNLDTTSRVGLTLNSVVHPDYLSEHGLNGLGDLTAHLLTQNHPGALEGALELGQRLQVWAETPIARVLFDSTLPPADTTVQATVWRTHTMEQPTALELSTEHLYRQLPQQKIFGRAYYRLLFATARRVCFADPSRPAALNLDELYDAMKNPENILDAQHFVRQGRRPKAIFGAGSHDAADAGDDVLIGLIPTRITMRHRDKGLATRALAWLGIGEDDPQHADYVKRLRTDTAPLIGDKVPPDRRGEGFIRDAFGNFGPMTWLPPATPHRRAAALSTPPKSTTRL